MSRAEIMALQERVGTTADGLWGPKSEAACKEHLRALMPENNPWPRSRQSDLRKFYGAPDDNGPIVRIYAPSWLTLYDTDTRVHKISCHEKVALSLTRALEAAYKVAPEHARRYFGCHVDRPVRGGKRPSVHAYGAAIDLAASTNGLRDSWPQESTMPIGVMEAFAVEGWTSAGAFWGYDAMHFESTRPS